jgi:hypothetical protein
MLDKGKWENDLTELEAFLVIEEKDLPLHASNQPKALFDAGRIKAEIKNELALADQTLTALKASTDLEVRLSDPGAIGLVKWTEPSIKAAVLDNQEVKDAQEVSRETQELSDYADSLFNAVYSKAQMINALVQLRVSMNYGSYTDEEKTHEKINRKEEK